jgi:hypothetical protein
VQISILFQLVVFAVALVGVGCARRRAATPQVVAVAAAVSSSTGPEANGGDGRGGSGGRSDDGGGDGLDNSQQRFPAASVYVDGVPVVAFTYNEMPPSVHVEDAESQPGERYHRVRVCDYLHNLGVECSDVKATHWYAGRSRVAVITGDELRHFRDRLYFNFTRDLRGKPRVEWHSGVHTNDTVDVVSDLAVYVKRTPPRWDREASALLDPEGNEVTGIPYASRDAIRGGVRVNLDGRLRARIKRNMLDGNVAPVDPNADSPRYRLTAFLASAGLKPGRLRGIDLITRDERVLRVGAEAANHDVQFAAPPGSHGEVTVYFEDHFVPVAAINLYAKSTPPERQMRTVTLRADKEVSPDGRAKGRRSSSL